MARGRVGAGKGPKPCSTDAVSDGIIARKKVALISPPWWLSAPDSSKPPTSSQFSFSLLLLVVERVAFVCTRRHQLRHEPHGRMADVCHSRAT